MARVYCIEWSEEDEAHTPRNVGWSLHLSRNQAFAYTRKHEARYDGHGDARCVEVPIEVLDAVRATREGLFWATPMACPFPIANEADMEREVAIDHEMAESPDEEGSEAVMPQTEVRERPRV